jgi:hypothetical protein
MIPLLFPPHHWLITQQEMGGINQVSNVFQQPKKSGACIFLLLAGWGCNCLGNVNKKKRSWA